MRRSSHSASRTPVLSRRFGNRCAQISSPADSRAVRKNATQYRRALKRSVTRRSGFLRRAVVAAVVIAVTVVAVALRLLAAIRMAVEDARNRLRFVELLQSSNDC